ncbi:MAG: cytochrome b/b6 domain-containing protein [Alphaproteobacteria bacterium]|nr:cytochrome b/b6 domain-containing protein [Alphaproteobacteria bacterium]MBV9374483.1 cytochrome b/b6 domain-containing protein [Alphaproteobacteria bacterium]
MDRPSPRAAVLHPLVVRITHWLNAMAIIIMIGSGWRIYNWDPLFDFSFPVWMTFGGWPEVSQRWHNEEGLAGALQWHFAAMWLLFVSLVIYIVYGLVSGHFRGAFLPIRPRELLRDTQAALAGRLTHNVGERNAVQKAMYVGVVIVMVLALLSGLSIWKPVQLQELTGLFGGYETARYVHFFCMAAIVLFLAIHLLLTALVPSVLPPMITGRLRARP